jgi:diadenosine tetraphosphatase ApaH/serine/threonine PP2A family protein phosphatase
MALPIYHFYCIELSTKIMRYAVFTDVHANLEALEAVLAKIDEIAAKEPIDKIWFLGDLVGYGPDPNECIVRLRERTNIIIAGNHDWAAVGKIDLEEFSPAARISAEWTAEQLTEEHRAFLENLPERLDIGECTLVHGSPYGPLWEYLTREEQALAERSFEYFTSRYCFVGHTHVPVIFQQPDVANTPTMPLGDTGEFEAIINFHANGIDAHLADENAGDDEETTEMAVVRSPAQQLLTTQSGDESAASAFMEPGSEQGGDTRADTRANDKAPEQSPSEAAASPIDGGNETQDDSSDDSTEYAIPLANVYTLTSDGTDKTNQGGSTGENQDNRDGLTALHSPYDTTARKEALENEEPTAPLFAEYGEESFAAAEPEVEQLALLEADNLPPEVLPVDKADSESIEGASGENAQPATIEHNDSGEDDDETTELELAGENDAEKGQQGDLMQQLDFDDYMTYLVEEGDIAPSTPESEIAEAEERLNGEIEELLTLLGLSQSLIPITNEMIEPPEGHWEAPEGYRAIVNPGGVGQPRDGDPRAAFMIYDSEKGFEFYRIPYDFEKTQEKIINAGLPQFLAVRLQFGR